MTDTITSLKLSAAQPAEGATGAAASDPAKGAPTPAATSAAPAVATPNAVDERIARMAAPHYGRQRT